MKLEWTQAPNKTQWGHDMVEAVVGMGKDHILLLYCERDQTEKVPKVLKPKWKNLTKREMGEIMEHGYGHWWGVDDYIKAVQKKLKEKNT